VIKHLEDDHPARLLEEPDGLLGAARRLHNITSAGIRVVGRQRMDAVFNLLKNMEMNARQRHVLRSWARCALFVAGVVVGPENQPPDGHMDLYAKTARAMV